MPVTNGIKVSESTIDIKKITSSTQEHPVASKAKGVFDLWRKSENVFKSMAAISQDFQEIEDAISSYGRIEIELETKNNVIADLMRANDTQSERWAERYLEWEKEKREWKKEKERWMQQEDEKLQDIMKEQKATRLQMIADMKKKLEDEQEKIKPLSQELKMVNAKLQSIEEQYAHCAERLRRWEDHTSLLKEVNFVKL